MMKPLVDEIPVVAGLIVALKGPPEVPLPLVPILTPLVELSVHPVGKGEDGICLGG